MASTISAARTGSEARCAAESAVLKATEEGSTESSAHMALNVSTAASGWPARAHAQMAEEKE